MIKLLDATRRQFAPRASPVPPYAILSHRWGIASDEINFQQISLADHGDFKHRPGYQKIMGLCSVALRLGLKHVWADTCCIDKTDYSVQSAALNSMFEWYRNAHVCCVYLDDVDPRNDVGPLEQFRQSKWFTRGWTLQELIAPLQVVFFDKDWNEIGTKSSLSGVITEITQIPEEVILMNQAKEMSIAQRMSWAAGRETSRVEDRAYSIMGLLGVSIPMLYGEGEKAFERLQIEIMKTSDDQSLFAWSRVGDGKPCGLLATSPDDFTGSHDIRQVIDNDPNPVPYGMTNKGLHINMHLDPQPPAPGNVCWATLRCKRGNGAPLLRIQLKRSDDDPITYTRVNLDQLVPGNGVDQPVTEVYIEGSDATRFEIFDWMRRDPPYVFVVRHRPEPDLVNMPGFEVNPNLAYEDFPGACIANWDREEGDGDFLLTSPESGHSGVLVFSDAEGARRLGICIGAHNWNAWCAIVENPPVNFQGFWANQGLSNRRWKNLDRQRFQIGEGNVSVALTRGLRGAQKVWYVDIGFTPDVHYSLTELGPGCCF
ncbi:hypothetical protein FDECE_9497 [Fusarium decemcellulare]|nr:hypothetical protein FDECE_9497 [Fusarium decemcellulare]